MNICLNFSGGRVFQEGMANLPINKTFRGEDWFHAGKKKDRHSAVAQCAIYRIGVERNHTVLLVYCIRFHIVNTIFKTLSLFFATIGLNSAIFRALRLIAAAIFHGARSFNNPCGLKMNAVPQTAQQLLRFFHIAGFPKRHLERAGIARTSFQYADVT